MQELTDVLLLNVEAKAEGAGERLKVSHSGAHSIEIKAQHNSLSLNILVSDKDVTFTYFTDGYSNYTELSLENSDSDQEKVEQIVDVVDEYLRNTVVRTDTYVGNKLTSSRLQIGDSNVDSIQGFKLFGIRHKETTSYDAPLKNI
jgi:oligoendopeptidase F